MSHVTFFNPYSKIPMTKVSVFSFQLFCLYFLTPDTRHLKPLILQSSIRNLKSNYPPLKIEKSKVAAVPNNPRDARTMRA
jgi:hypothetical protein